MTGVDREPSHARRRLVRNALRLNVVLVTWNVAEGVIATWLAIRADSVALLGFGIDSAIEVSSALVLAWRLNRELRGRDEDAGEWIEQRAERIAGTLLAALALWIVIDASRRLAGFGGEPQPSLGGIVLTSLSLVVMPTLGFWKLRIAKRIESGSLRADAFETITCGWLSLTTLSGLSLRATLGWTWADPLAALLIVPLIVREAWEAVTKQN
jgi:divalent metal cation (Fe/Co/Zn/Cd) transporter